ncbi:hypothetical protein NMG60_11002014 [Bertholletia excelsa]
MELYVHRALQQILTPQKQPEVSTLISRMTRSFRSIYLLNRVTDSFQSDQDLIPWHISESRIEQSFRTWFCQSCTCEQSQAQADHQGLGL